MKKKSLIVADLALSILLLNLVIGFANAQPYPIGSPDYKQETCFDSNPTTGTYEGIGTPTGAITYAFDGALYTNINFLYGNDGFVQVSAFKKPSDNGLADFWISFVDVKIDYRALATAAADDQYRIIAYVDPSPTEIVLQDWVWGNNATNHNAMYPPGINTDPAIRTWSNVAEPNDGAWTWTDLANLRLRIETKLVGTSNFQRFYLYEVWATAYQTSYPALATLSVQPSIVMEIAGGIFYVDIYVTGVTQLWGYQFMLLFDPNVLMPLEYFGYGPFIGSLPSEIGPDYVVVARKTYDKDPVGFTGSTPIARIYFVHIGVPGIISSLPFSPDFQTSLADVYGNQIPFTLVNGWFRSREDLQPPNIEGATRNPETPNYDENVVVTATITDYTQVDAAILSYTVDSLWQNTTMNQYGDEFNATIPAQPYDTLVEYKIYTNDTLGNEVTSSVHSYTVTDNKAPETTTSRSPEQPRSNQPLKISADVTEPATASGVKAPIVLYYRVNGAQWSTTNMTHNEQSNLWEATIPGQQALSLVEYYIKAQDNAGNENTTQTYSYTVALAGDANLDHIVDVVDAAAVSAHWYPGPPIGSLGYDPAYDLNFDGTINILDSAIVSADWNKTW